MAQITVIGSINVDMVTVTPRVPEGGETLEAKSFETGWGGKGANQAVAAARLSRTKSRPDHSDTEVRMIGAVGKDVFGPQMVKSLGEDGIDTSGIKMLDGMKTGVAVILVEEGKGENRILFTAGANAGVDKSMKLVKNDQYGDVAVFQLETPLDVVTHHIQKAEAGGTRTILNPAPAQKLPLEIYKALHYLIMNESEAAILSGRPADSLSSESDLESVAADFIAKGVANVIITLGGEGAYYQTVTSYRKGIKGRKLPAVKAKVVDTTAAGDTFVGAFAIKIADAVAEGGDEASVIDQAVAFAIRAAGKTVEKPGAQNSIPWLNELQESR